MKLEELKRKRLERMQVYEEKAEKKFKNNILNDGFAPINNDGGGNCMFISLALIVFGDAAKSEFMRYMIVHRMKNFPKKYQG